MVCNHLQLGWATHSLKAPPSPPRPLPAVAAAAAAPAAVAARAAPAVGVVLVVVVAAAAATAITDVTPFCIPVRIRVAVIRGLPSKKPGVLIPKSPNPP